MPTQTSAAKAAAAAQTRLPNSFQSNLWTGATLRLWCSWYPGLYVLWQHVLMLREVLLGWRRNPSPSLTSFAHLAPWCLRIQSAQYPPTWAAKQLSTSPSLWTTITGFPAVLPSATATITCRTRKENQSRACWRGSKSCCRTCMRSSSFGTGRASSRCHRRPCGNRTKAVIPRKLSCTSVEITSNIYIYVFQYIYIYYTHHMKHLLAKTIYLGMMISTTSWRVTTTVLWLSFFYFQFLNLYLSTWGTQEGESEVRPQPGPHVGGSLAEAHQREPIRLDARAGAAGLALRGGKGSHFSPAAGALQRCLCWIWERRFKCGGYNE